MAWLISLTHPDDLGGQLSTGVATAGAASVGRAAESTHGLSIEREGDESAGTNAPKALTGCRRPEVPGRAVPEHIRPATFGIDLRITR